MAMGIEVVYSDLGEQKCCLGQTAWSLGRGGFWGSLGSSLGYRRGLFLVQSPFSWPLCMSDVLGWRLVVRIHKTAFGDAMASLWGRCMDHALVV